MPVGAYLSGGLDSSIITAAVKRIRPDRLRTFSVTFESEEFDESAYQQDMVRALGTEHSAVACTAADIGRAFPTVIRHTERPILRTAPTPLLQLSELARASGYKVVLTGEGADEVFAGYDIFKEAKIRRFCAVAAAVEVAAAAAQAALSLPAAAQGPVAVLSRSLLRRAARRRRRSAVLAPAALSHHRGRQAVLLRRPAQGRSRATTRCDELRERLPADFARWHPLSQAQYLETAHLLPGYILSSQGDRVAMAHAVEGRFPFLDHRVVEFAARIPPKLKIRGLREKHILREAMKGLLPPHIGNRTKQPYRAPDCQSFVGAEAPAYVGHRLSGGDIARGRLFRPGRGRQARQQVPQPEAHRISRQHGLRRRALDAAVASRIRPGRDHRLRHPLRRCMKTKGLLAMTEV